MIGRKLRVIWNPEMFQGSMEKRNYFEGWYYKSVDATRQHSYAIIPGISFGSTEEESHSFVQVLRGNDAFSTYHKFSLQDFSYSEEEFDIRIGKNRFSLNGIELDIVDGENEIRGKLDFEGIQGWPVSRFSPGAMGPFRLLPRIQCLHGILSFDHHISGSVRFYDDDILFTEGRGYIEKDWGKEFPSSWVWMQTNHFEEKDISFTSSIANIPFLRRNFAGFLIGLLYNGKIYRFTTYNRSRISDFSVEDDEVRFQVENKRHCIKVKAHRAKGGSLQSPVEGLMTGRILETLNAKISIEFFENDHKSKRLLFEGTGTNAGLEVVGDMNEIGAIDMQNK